MVCCINLDLAKRSIRTLAWLGDAHFELDVRLRLCARGDYPADRLDAMKASIVCARQQAEFLEAIAPLLDDSEASIVQRGRNSDIGSKSRGRTDVRTHRSATGLEALIAYWLSDSTREPRYAELLGPLVTTAIDEAVVRLKNKPRRG